MLYGKEKRFCVHTAHGSTAHMKDTRIQALFDAACVSQGQLNYWQADTLGTPQSASYVSVYLVCLVLGTHTRKRNLE